MTALSIVLAMAVVRRRPWLAAGGLIALAASDLDFRRPAASASSARCAGDDSD
jgi:hypothetical protein